MQTLTPVHLDRFVVSTRTRSLTSTITVAAPDAATAHRLALASWRRHIPGYTDLRVCVTNVGPPLGDSDMDRITTMESEDFSASYAH